MFFQTQVLDFLFTLSQQQQEEQEANHDITGGKALKGLTLLYQTKLMKLQSPSLILTLHIPFDFAPKIFFSTQRF